MWCVYVRFMYEDEGPKVRTYLRLEQVDRQIWFLDLNRNQEKKK